MDLSIKFIIDIISSVGFPIVMALLFYKLITSLVCERMSNFCDDLKQVNNRLETVERDLKIVATRLDDISKSFIDLTDVFNQIFPRRYKGNGG